MTATPLRIATCKPLPEPDPDEAPLAAALAAGGFAAELLAWDDPAADWDAPIPTILRSTWNYPLAIDAFRAWIDRASAAALLINPPDVVRDNLHKRYLLALEARGVPIISTHYRERGQAISDWTAPWDEVVVKPVIGASSVGVGQFRLPQQRLQMEQHATRLLEQTGVLFQRYEPSVRTEMERSLVFIAGACSHAVRRIPFNLGSTPDTDEFDHRASVEEIQLARRVLAAAGADGAPYARVDLLPTSQGLVLMELELIDPALFLTRRPAAAAELAAALVACVR